MTDEMDKPTSRKRAIRMKCLDCCCQQQAEVRKCRIESCPLWEFRMGKDPYHSRKRGDDETAENTSTEDDFED